MTLPTFCLVFLPAFVAAYLCWIWLADHIYEQARIRESVQYARLMEVRYLRSLVRVAFDQGWISGRQRVGYGEHPDERGIDWRASGVKQDLEDIT